MTNDKNDLTGEVGYWMDRGDAQETAAYFRKLEILEREWRPEEQK